MHQNKSARLRLVAGTSAFALALVMASGCAFAQDEVSAVASDTTWPSSPLPLLLALLAVAVLLWSRRQ